MMLKVELEAKVAELEAELTELRTKWAELGDELEFAERSTQDNLTALNGSLEQIKLVKAFVRPDEGMVDVESA